MKTPANAIGIEPMQSHRTRGHRTVRRRICTPPPTGFMIMAATRSDETAAVGLIPKKITRIGVMSALPPIPVIPTMKPTMAPASTMAQSICTVRYYGRPRRARGAERLVAVRLPRNLLAAASSGPMTA